MYYSAFSVIESFAPELKDNLNILFNKGYPHKSLLVGATTTPASTTPTKTTNITTILKPGTLAASNTATNSTVKTGNSTFAIGTSSKITEFPTPIYNVINNDAFNIVVVLIGASIGSLLGLLFYIVWYAVK